MEEGQKLWTREELILAVNLYYKIPFGRMHNRNPEVIKLANILGRTPNSVAYKLVNFASLDPSLQSRGIKSASNTSKADRTVWEEFYHNLENLAFESEKLLAQTEQITVAQLHHITEDEVLPPGITREVLVKQRVNQAFFRRSVLAAYNNTCCITGLQMPNLLVAGHIVPWAADAQNRLNPRNGIAINALHDKAFENGLLTITPEYTIRVSSLLKEQQPAHVADNYFRKYDGQQMLLPTKFLPNPEFLRAHGLRFRE